MTHTRTVHVPTTSRAYDVHIGDGILEQVPAIVGRLEPYVRVRAISDSNVAPLYGQRLMDAFDAATYAASLAAFEAGEKSKRLSTIECLLEGMAAEAFDRDALVVALGGGVTGDMAGLVAAMYLRGIDYVQVPTSLLAMVDSSVGGKCAVDLSAGKNLAGAFLQPRAVIADVSCLDTIAPELLRDSCGEVIKHAVLADPDMLQDLLRSPIQAEHLDHERMVDLVARNVEIKREVVAADERERGARQTLNLGHTIGHAIETASDFALGHGSSVAAGLCIMARGCAAIGLCDTSPARVIQDCVRAHGLPTTTDVPTDALVDIIGHDKKRHGSTVNAVIVRDIGQVQVDAMDFDAIRTMIDLGREDLA